jgi:hypothetical protein
MQMQIITGAPRLLNRPVAFFASYLSLTNGQQGFSYIVSLQP